MLLFTVRTYRAGQEVLWIGCNNNIMTKEKTAPICNDGWWWWFGDAVKKLKIEYDKKEEDNVGCVSLLVSVWNVQQQQKGGGEEKKHSNA
jgi:hypothetical protein